MSIIVVAPNYPAYGPACQQPANPEMSRHLRQELGATGGCGCKGHCMCGKTNANLPQTNNTLEAQLNRLEMKQNQLLNLQMQNQAQLAQMQSRLNIKA